MGRETSTGADAVESNGPSEPAAATPHSNSCRGHTPNRVSNPDGRNPKLYIVISVNDLSKPARLGMLATTADSFDQVFWGLNKRVETWGRGPNNTEVHPHAKDVRIPKVGVCIFHHARGIEKLDEKGADWTSMTDLHTLITTHSNHGISVNGEQLRKHNEHGSYFCGKIYTGDVITVYKSEDVCFEFVCKFEYGEGKKVRPADLRPFKIDEVIQRKE
jgi:hypothetical protein